MARPLLPADLWREIAPLLPPPQPRLKGGRRPIENRAALTGNLVRAALRIALGDATRGDGLRLRDEVLAPPARLAGRRRVGTAASGAAEADARGRRDRLGSYEPGQCRGPGQEGGPATGPNPSEAPSIRRRTLTMNRFEPRRGSSAFGRRSGPGCGPGCGSVRSAARTRGRGGFTARAGDPVATGPGPDRTRVRNGAHGWPDPPRRNGRTGDEGREGRRHRGDRARLSWSSGRSR